MLRTNILIKYKSLLVEFCNELSEQFPHEGDFRIAKVILSSSQIPTEKLMTNFLKNLTPDIREKIKNRDIEFLHTGNPFSFIADSRFAKFTDLILGGTVSDEDKDIIWQWIEALVKIADKYLTTL